MNKSEQSSLKSEEAHRFDGSRQVVSKRISLGKSLMDHIIHSSSASPTFANGSGLSKHG